MQTCNIMGVNIAVTGMDKTLRKGMTALGPFLAKHSKSFNEIANMKNGVTGEKGFNKSMRMARKMQSEGNIPTRYPANMQGQCDCGQQKEVRQSGFRRRFGDFGHYQQTGKFAVRFHDSVKI